MILNNSRLLMFLILSLMLLIFLASSVLSRPIADCFDQEGRAVPCTSHEDVSSQSYEGVWIGGIFFFGIIALCVIVVISLVAFWVWMLVDCIQREFKDKVLWLLIILLTGFLGAVIYFFVVKRRENAKFTRRVPLGKKPKKKVKRYV